MKFVRLFLVIALCLFTGIAKADIYGPPGSASDIETNTTNFDNNLSTADTNIQKALDTIDNLTIVTAETNNLETVTTGIASGEIPIGTGAGVSTYAAISGDAALSSTGVLGVNKTRLNVRNETGVQIASTKVVYASGFNNLPLISLADNTDETKHDTLGLTIAPINHEANGFIATNGQCDAETNTWLVGTTLYLSTAGALTSTQPTSGAVKIVGIVTVQANYPTGKILLSPRLEENITAGGANTDVILRTGDAIGVNKISFRDYANAEVASVNSDGVLVFSSSTNNLGAFAATTSAQLYGVISDETGSASGTPLLVFNQNPTINGLTGTGVYDLGGATTFELPNAANPTLSTTGQIAINTTDKTLEFNNGTAQIAIPTIHIAQGTFDLKAQYAVDPDLWLIDLNADSFPHGIYITKIYVDATVADPTTELTANLNYCDATSAAFPGANPTLIKAINTTAGNFADAAVNTAVPTGKSIYITMGADPTDANVQYHIRIHYYIPTA